MKKVNNNKIKRGFIIVLIAVLLFGYIEPLKVYGESSYPNYSGITSYVKEVTGEEKTNNAWNQFKKDKYSNERNSLINELKNNTLKGMTEEKIDEMLTLREGNEYYFANAIYINYSDDYQIKPNSSSLSQGDWALPGYLCAICKFLEDARFSGLLISHCKSIIQDIKTAEPDSVITVSVQNGSLVMQFKLTDTSIIQQAFEKRMVDPQNIGEALITNDLNHYRILCRKKRP